MTCDILDTSRGYPTYDDKISTKVKLKVLHSLAPALTLSLKKDISFTTPEH